MEKTDLRKLSDESREAFIRTAIRLLKKGNTQKEVAETLGCHPRTISNWWRSYKKEGLHSLKPKKRGRREGEKRKVTQDQEKSLTKMLMEKYPDQLKLPYALWTRKAVQELILLKYKIKMPIRTVGEYLKRWGFTPQKPIRRAYEQQPEKVKKWGHDYYYNDVEKSRARGREAGKRYSNKNREKINDNAKQVREAIYADPVAHETKKAGDRAYKNAEYKKIMSDPIKAARYKLRAKEKARRRLEKLKEDSVAYEAHKKKGREACAIYKAKKKLEKATMK